MEDNVNTVEERTETPSSESDSAETTEADNDEDNESIEEPVFSSFEDSRTKALEFLKIEDPKANSKGVVVTDTVDKTLLHKKLDKQKDVGQTKKLESVKDKPKGKGRKKVAIEEPPSDWSVRASIVRLFGPKKVDKEKLAKEANLKLQAEKEEKKKKEAEQQHREREARKLKSFEKLKQARQLRQEANTIMTKTPNEYWSRDSVVKLFHRKSLDKEEESDESLSVEAKTDDERNKKEKEKRREEMIRPAMTKETQKFKKLGEEREVQKLESLDSGKNSTEKRKEDGTDTPKKTDQIPDDISTKHFISKSVPSSDPPNSAQDRSIALEFIKMEDPKANSKGRKMVDEHSLKEAEERKPERSARKVKILESIIDASVLQKYKEGVGKIRHEKKEGNINELSLEDEKKKAAREAWLETRRLERLKRKEEKVELVLKKLAEEAELESEREASSMEKNEAEDKQNKLPEPPTVDSEDQLS